MSGACLIISNDVVNPISLRIGSKYSRNINVRLKTRLRRWIKPATIIDGDKAADVCS